MLGACVSRDHLAQDANGVGLDGLRKFNVLDHVEPTLAQLDLRDIGLRPLELSGDIFLPKPGAFASSDQRERK